MAASEAMDKKTSLKLFHEHKEQLDFNLILVWRWGNVRGGLRPPAIYPSPELES